jgi:hypothetical protein
MFGGGRSNRYTREKGGNSMPARIDLIGDCLVVTLDGGDRLWALKSRLQIPLVNVTGAHRAEEAATKWLQGFRAGGTHIRGVVSAGRFYSRGQFAFWDVHDGANAIAIQLRDEHFDKLVIEVTEPEAEVDRIRRATAGVLAA